MKIYAYSVFDRVAETYNTPFFIPSQAQAKRTFSNIVIDGDSQLHKNPSDYALCEVGNFDDKTGVFYAYVSPLEILDADEVLNLHHAAQASRAPVADLTHSNKAN